MKAQAANKRDQLVQVCTQLCLLNFTCFPVKKHLEMKIMASQIIVQSWLMMKGDQVTCFIPAIGIMESVVTLGNPEHTGLVGVTRSNCRLTRQNTADCALFKENKPIQDGGEAKAPLWLNRLSGTNWLTD